MQDQTRLPLAAGQTQVKASRWIRSLPWQAAIQGALVCQKNGVRRSTPDSRLARVTLLSW